MAASIVRRLYLTLCVSGARRVHLPIKYSLHYRIVDRYYRSIVRLNFYPRLNYGSKAEGYTQDEQINTPLDRLTISYSRSSGPGGQHVNKVNTKAEIRFHVQTADWIPEDVRNMILQRNKTRINKAGELFVTSEVSRSQQRNLEDCLRKIRVIIAEANQKPCEPTAEHIALKHARLEKRKREILKQKKINSALKKSRRVDFD